MFHLVLRVGKSLSKNLLNVLLLQEVSGHFQIYSLSQGVSKADVSGGWGS